MQCGDPNHAPLVPQSLLQAVPHLSGRRPGERKSSNPGGGDVVNLNQVLDAANKHERFSRSGPGKKYVVLARSAGRLALLVPQTFVP